MARRFPFFVFILISLTDKDLTFGHRINSMYSFFQYKLNEVAISINDIAVLMGYEPDSVPEPVYGMIQTGLAESHQFCDIRGGFGIFDTVHIDPKHYTIQVNEQIFHTGKIVATQLKEAKKVALFIGTAGAGISEHAQNISKKGDLLQGYIFDVIGSVVVEKAIEQIQIELINHIKQDGLSVSNRFSPGYCDWQVAEQQKLFSLFPPGFCGVTLSDSMLMNPIKSVSGIIGIGAGLKQTGAQCNWCHDPNCIYGKIRRQKKALKKI